jgi:hypothetical protein
MRWNAFTGKMPYSYIIPYISNRGEREREGRRRGRIRRDEGGEGKKNK